MTLGPDEERLVRLSAAIAAGRWEVVRGVRREVSAPGRAWREAVLQTHLFAGFPRLVEAYAVLGEEGGLGALEPGEARAEPDRPEKGRAVFERVYAGAAADVRARLEAHHPDFARWIEGHAYGRVLARPGLALDRRELCAVACLAVLGQDRQLASHARGALRAGATPDELRAAVAIAGELGAASERAFAVLERLAAGDPARDQ